MRFRLHLCRELLERDPHLRLQGVETFLNQLFVDGIDTVLSISTKRNVVLTPNVLHEGKLFCPGLDEAPESRPWQLFRPNHAAR
jgi:hypothetical protein